MERYIEKLQQYAEHQNIESGFSNADSIIQMLYYWYTQSNPISNEQIQAQFRTLDAILTPLSLEDNDKVFFLTCSLCENHSKSAFQEGLLLGMRLQTEIDAHSNTNINE